ncbi:hypothetical protein N2152v2_000645 [Parachlorella kessleri]
MGDAAAIRALFAQYQPEGMLQKAGSSQFYSPAGPRALVDGGINVDSADKNRRTPLLIAAREGNVDAVRKLLAAGANINACDCKGHTALRLAAFGGHLKVVQALLAAGRRVRSRCNVNSRCKAKGATALHIAASKGDIAIMEALVAAGADCGAVDIEGRSPLVWAARYNRIIAVRKLLELGTAVEASALTIAAITASPQLLKEGDSADAIKALAAAGASINARDNRGRTALHGFARHGQRVAAFKALLEAGADMNASDTAGVTVLLAAIKAFSAEAARLIMAVGEDSAAEVAAASRTNPTPLDLMLFENGSNWLQCNIEASAIVELIGELAAAGCPVDTRLPARCGDPGLQPSTLETWLARLAKHGWPASPDDRDKVLQFSRVLLSSAAAQGSQGRPELLAAAEAVGSPELVAAVQKILPVVEASPNSTAAAMPRDQPIAGDKR